MTDRFTELLKELSVEFGVPLHPDRKGACQLKMNETCSIQLECTLSQEKLLIATFICDVPPGKLRENIFKDTLKANGPFSKIATLAYSDRNNQLTLFTHLPFVNLSGHTLSAFLLEFCETSNLWRKAVDTGQTAQLVPLTPKSSVGMFGLKP